MEETGSNRPPDPFRWDATRLAEGERRGGSSGEEGSLERFRGMERVIFACGRGTAAAVALAEVAMVPAVVMTILTTPEADFVHLVTLLEVAIKAAACLEAAVEVAEVTAAAITLAVAVSAVVAAAVFAEMEEEVESLCHDGLDGQVQTALWTSR
mmetsp:Transcript_6794/g.14646  ORF Transcript_6794/g.14646 Transcript_6794/m.14646 type:complete len:154 (+) Transcript_6794:1850-2311(+)